MASFTWSKEIAMTPEEIDAFLSERLVARVSTHRPDGHIHSTPLWYEWDGEYLYLALGKVRQHVTNLQRDPKVTVLIDVDPRMPEGDLSKPAKAVEIRGTAELTDDESVQVERTRTLLRRYFGEKGEELLEGALGDGQPGKNRVIAKISPDKIIAWDFSKLDFSY